VDHFNKDYKKGFAAMQAVKLLPEHPPATDSEETRTAARQVLAMRLGQFLRTCPGLNKTTIGELLGDPDAFYLQVRDSRGRPERRDGDAYSARLLPGLPSGPRVLHDRLRLHAPQVRLGVAYVPGKLPVTRWVRCLGVCRDGQDGGQVGASQTKAPAQGAAGHERRVVHGLRGFGSGDVRLPVHSYLRLAVTHMMSLTSVGSHRSLKRRATGL
jgi:hypothetical protein